MAILQRRVRRSTVGRARWRSIVLAGVAALSTSLLALAAPAQAGLLGGGTSEYIVSAPAGSMATALNAVGGVGATAGSTFSFVNAVTAQLTPLQVSLLQVVPGIAVTPDLTVNVQGSTGACGTGTRGGVPAAVRCDAAVGAGRHRVRGQRGRARHRHRALARLRRPARGRGGPLGWGKSLAGQLRARHVRGRPHCGERCVVGGRVHGRGARRRAGLRQGRGGQRADRSGHADSRAWGGPSPTSPTTTSGSSTCRSGTCRSSPR